MPATKLALIKIHLGRKLGVDSTIFVLLAGVPTTNLQPARYAGPQNTTFRQAVGCCYGAFWQKPKGKENLVWLFDYVFPACNSAQEFLYGFSAESLEFLSQCNVCDGCLLEINHLFLRHHSNTQNHQYRQLLRIER